MIDLVVEGCLENIIVNSQLGNNLIYFVFESETVVFGTLQRYKYDKCDLNSGNCTFLFNFETIPQHNRLSQASPSEFSPHAHPPLRTRRPSTPCWFNYIPTKIIGRLLRLPIFRDDSFFFPHTTIRNPRFAFISLASNDQQELLDSSFRLLSNVTTAKGGAPQARNCVRLEAAVLHVEEVSNVVQRGVQCVKTKIICCVCFSSVVWLFHFFL